MKAAVIGLLLCSTSFASVLKSTLSAERLLCYDDGRECRLNMPDTPSRNPSYTIIKNASEMVKEVLVDFKREDDSFEY